jgi:hypothetical protein
MISSGQYERRVEDHGAAKAADALQALEQAQGQYRLYEKVLENGEDSLRHSILVNIAFSQSRPRLMALVRKILLFQK